jgi:hypothetical protein
VAVNGNSYVCMAAWMRAGSVKQKIKIKKSFAVCS